VVLMGKEIVDGGAPVVRAPTNLEVSLSIVPDGGPGGAWLSLGSGCDGARSRSVLVTVPEGQPQSPDVQVCSDLEGGRHHLVAQVGSVRTPDVNVEFEPREVAVLFTPVEGAGGASSTTAYSVSMSAPCGGELEDLTLVVDGDEELVGANGMLTLTVSGQRSVRARRQESASVCSPPVVLGGGGSTP